MKTFDLWKWNNAPNNSYYCIGMAPKSKFPIIFVFIITLVLDFLLFSTIVSLVRQPSNTDVLIGLSLLLVGAVANYYLFVRYFKHLL